ncbi:MAG: ATP-binding protein [Chloroflexota bacterium]
MYALNFIVGAVFTITAGLFVFFRGESRSITRRAWLLLCLATSVWHLGRFLIAIAPTLVVADQCVYVIYLGAILIPPFYLHFSLSLLNEEDAHRLELGGAYSVAAVEYVLLFSGHFTAGVRLDPALGYYEIPSKIYLLHFLAFVLVPTYGLLKLVAHYRISDLPVKKNQLKYVIFASLIGFLGGGTSFLPIIQAPIPPFGAPLTYFYTFPIAYAIARYRLMDIGVVLRKGLIYALLLLGLLVPCYAVVVISQYVIFGSISYSFSVVTLLLLTVVGFLFPKIRFKTEDALERALFKKRSDFRETVLRSSRDMVSIVDIRALSNSLVQTIGKSLGVDKVSLLLKNETNGIYRLEAFVGLDFDPSEGVFLSKDGPLVQLLQRRREGIVKEELEWVPVGPDTPHTIDTMAKLEAELSLPIISQERLIGILNLGQKEDQTIYSSEDLELLSTLANQAAIALENARLYENLKQSQDTLRRADRLSSLGLLTAGLAHEIRNPLVAIRTFTQLLPERYDDAEFREGFQGLALKEVDRICGLINDLLSFARPSKPNVAPENIGDVIENIARILETQAKEKGVEILRDFGESLPKVWIDREQMKQVFMNLILNAIQAMQAGGSINISTRAISRAGTEPSGEFVQVEVRDTGVGIPEDNLQHIFDPFFTSKEEGSGLGLAVSHQIVQEHGGFVTVESKVGKGTAFFVHIPVGKPSRSANNLRAQANEANLSH